MKKVLSIVLSLVLVICMMPVMAFAGSNDAVYSDIAGEKCEGAVNVLDALGVIDGYEEGTYKPEKVVTRAEMAKLIITALGMESYATATKSSYSDMANAQWAIPVVEYATNLGIIEGVGGGRFSPGNPVTYEQAATMIVRAIGFTTDCNEMNGTWPAIYVQKATALGLFRNVEGNQYGTGANRGDIAIMLYNALDIPQVYTDKDGQTNNKRGEAYTDANGQTYYTYVTMMSTLNKDGSSKYEVIESDVADSAVTNIRPYIGAAAKVTKDKDDRVIAVGDIKTTFLTGKVSADGKKFTANDVEYTLPAAAGAGYVDIDANTGGKKASDAADKILNGYTVAKTGAALENSKTFTIAAKVSGKTIKEIYSVATWDATDADIVSESQINTIKSKKALLGSEFTLNDDNEIDMDSFELVGVDSLDKIEKDDVVYVYASNDTKTNKITRVAVGQKTVTGKLTKVTNKEKYTVDGTEYKVAAKEVAGITAGSTDYDIASDVKAGDTVTITLDAYGNIYKLEADSANRAYAAVLKSGKTTNAYGDDTYSLQFLNAEGETVTANVDSDYNEKYVAEMDEFDGSDDGAVTPAKADKTVIVKYHLNSSNEIDFITNEEVASQGVEKKVSSAGYYDGYELASNVVIFSYNGNDYSKADNYTVVKREDAIGKEFTANYATNEDKIVLMVADDLVASDVIYGLLAGYGSNDSDAGYYVDILTPDGETTSYDCSLTAQTEIINMAGFDAQNLLGFKLSSNNEIKSGKIAKVVTGIEATLGGDDVLAKAGTVSANENGRLTLTGADNGSYAFKDAIVYKYNATKKAYEVDEDTAVVESSDKVAIFDIEGEDKVYDVIVKIKNDDAVLLGKVKATEATADDFAKAGITGVTAANVDDVKSVVATNTGTVTDLAKVQACADLVNATLNYESAVTLKKSQQVSGDLTSLVLVKEAGTTADSYGKTFALDTALETYFDVTDNTKVEWKASNDTTAPVAGVLTVTFKDTTNNFSFDLDVTVTLDNNDNLNDNK